MLFRSASSSSDDVRVVKEPAPARRKSPSQVEVQAKEERRSKGRHERDTGKGLHKKLGPELAEPAEIRDVFLRELPVAK